MSADPRAHARAAVLVTTLTFEPRPIDLFELRVPAIRRVVAIVTPPLNLDAAIFRYRIDREINVTVIGDPIGARNCQGPHVRHRRR